MHRSIEDLRADEETGKPLSLEEQIRLETFYTQIETEEIARLALHRRQMAQKSTTRANYLARLEVLLEQKTHDLQQLEKLVELQPESQDNQ